MSGKSLVSRQPSIDVCHGSVSRENLRTAHRAVARETCQSKMDGTLASGFANQTGG